MGDKLSRDASRVLGVNTNTNGTPNHEYFVKVASNKFEYYVTDSNGGYHSLNALRPNADENITGYYTYSRPVAGVAAQRPNELVTLQQLEDKLNELIGLGSVTAWFDKETYELCFDLSEPDAISFYMDEEGVLFYTLNIGASITHTLDENKILNFIIRF